MIGVIESQSEGSICPLCGGQIGLGDHMKSYLSQWSHYRCVVNDVTDRSEHTPGYTYFLLLEDGGVKVGFTAKPEGIKQRIRRTYENIHPVSSVIGVMDGGASLEALMHYKFQAYADGRTETFHPAESLLIQARQGAGHEMVSIGNEYLTRNKRKWVKGSQP